MTPDGCTVKCGDGIVTAPIEQCDDGNISSNDGCSNTCQFEIGFTCSNSASNNPMTSCSEVCGDGVRYLAACDDGNTVSGDGCSSSCTVEAGFS